MSHNSNLDTYGTHFSIKRTCVPAGEEEDEDMADLLGGGEGEGEDEEGEELGEQRRGGRGGMRQWG